jgi:hypothetical protein
MQFRLPYVQLTTDRYRPHAACSCGARSTACGVSVDEGIETKLVKDVELVDLHTRAKFQLDSCSRSPDTVSERFR